MVLHCLLNWCSLYFIFVSQDQPLLVLRPLDFCYLVKSVLLAYTICIIVCFFPYDTPTYQHSHIPKKCIMFIEEQLRGNMQTINELFSNAVARYGKRPALSEPAEGDRMSTLTYRELQERAQQFAGYLQNEQFAKGDRLLLWSASRIDWLVAYLGALLVGVIVVPLDVNSKEDFLDRVSTITGAKLLITTSKQWEGLKNISLSFVDIDTLPRASLDTSKLPDIDG